MRRISISLLLIAALSGCGQRSTRPAKTSAPAEVPAAEKSFPSVAMPSYINSDEAAVEYMTDHYWDKFDFSDTTYVNLPEVTERAFANYLSILSMRNDYSASRPSVAHLFARAQPYPAMYEYLWELADKYLYDPMSPLRDPELYIPVMQSVIANPNVDELLKLAPRQRLEMALKNRIGEKAIDFTFTTSEGAAGSLYGIKADYTVLFFYNLGCQMCKGVMEEMQNVLSEPTLASMFESGTLKVLALYPDEHMEEWDKYLGTIPARWINAYDRDQVINGGRLYDLKAIPSLYLLDKEKRVLLKDFTEAEKIYYGIMGM